MCNIMLQNTTGSCDVITVTYFLFVEEGAASFRHEVSVDAVHDEDAARVTSPDQLHLIAAKVFSRIRSESCLQETRMLLYFIACDVTTTDRLTLSSRLSRTWKLRLSVRISPSFTT